jgi:hypothetical protein
MPQQQQQQQQQQQLHQQCNNTMYLHFICKVKKKQEE